MASWPGMKGSVGLSGQSPCAAWRSVWHTPQASVLMRIWPTPGEGTSRSWIANGFPNCSTTAANILCVMGNPVRAARSVLHIRMDELAYLLLRRGRRERHPRYGRDPAPRQNPGHVSDDVDQPRVRRNYDLRV